MKRRYNGLRDRELITHKSQSNYNGRKKEGEHARFLLEARHYVQSLIQLR